MKKCPLTYQLVQDMCYSSEGLKRLSPKLQRLRLFPFKQDEQYQLLFEFGGKFSFSGVQPKFGAHLNLKKETFEITKSGHFIIKLPRTEYPQLPENEDLTMKLAEIVGIEVPQHGLIYAIDSSLLYFVKRFDRQGRQKFATEDFGQLLGLSSEKKYESSMEKIIQAIEKFCTFPAIEKEKFFRLTLFNFLIGNEDMHVKNFSVITQNGITKLTPSYDLVNTSIVIGQKEEIALSLDGKKSKLKRDTFIQYLGIERLGLQIQQIEEILSLIRKNLSNWEIMIDLSFLSEDRKAAYKSLIKERAKRLLTF